MSKFSDFYSAASKNEEAMVKLAEILDGKKLVEATDEQLKEIGNVAEKLGFNITIEEAKKYLDPNSSELDDDDLDAVAGGKGETSVVTVYKGEEKKHEWVDGKMTM